MAIIKQLYPYLRHSYYQQLSENNFQKAQRLGSSWLIFVIGLRFFLNVFSSGYQFNLGNHFTAQAMAAFNLNFLFLFWLIAPVSRGLRKPSGNILNLRFVLSPVKKQDYLFIQLYDFIQSPTTLILIGTSLISFLPLWLFSFSWNILFASLFYLVFLFCFSFLLSLIPKSLFYGFKLQELSKFLLICMAMLLLYANPEFQWNKEEVNLILYFQKIMFRSAQGHNIFQTLQLYTPGGWLTATSELSFIPAFIRMFILSMILIGSITFLSLNYPVIFLKNHKKGQLKKTSLTLSLNQTPGLIVIKNSFIQLKNHPGTLTGLVLNLIFVIYSISRSNQNPLTYYLIAGASLTLTGSYFLNSLGQDYHLVNRFILTPGWSQHDFKKRAQLLLFQMIPGLALGLTGLFHLSNAAGLNYLIYCLVFPLAVFCLGNFTSIVLFYPIKAHSSETQGLEKDTLIKAFLVLFWCGLYYYEMSFTHQNIFGPLLMLVFTSGLFIFMIKRAPDYFNMNLILLQKETEALHL